MKRKDIGLIAVIVIVSAVISLFASKAIFTSPQNREQQVEVVLPITSDFPQPDTHYFNSDAYDPTRLITIGKNDNTDPFNGTGTNQ